MIEFILSPIGRYLAIAVAAFIGMSGLYLKGRSDGSTICKAEGAQSDLETIRKANEARERIRLNPPADGVRDPFDRDQ